MNIKITTEMQKLIGKANREILRIQKWYEEHKEAFDDMNLKLYDAFFYDGSEDMKKQFLLCSEYVSEAPYDSWYHEFADATYEQFDDWVREEVNKNGFREYAHHIGRTSSFYLHDQNIVQFERGVIDWGGTIESAVQNLFGWNNWVYYKENGMIDEEKTFGINKDNWYSSEEDILDGIEKEIDYIANELYDDFVKEFDDVIRVYEYIKDTKDNQVEYFKEWLQYKEDDFEYERKQEEEAEKQREKKRIAARNLFYEYCDKYNIPVDDYRIMADAVITGWA